MPAGNLSIQQRCFSFGTVERNDPSSVWPLMPQMGSHRIVTSSVHIMTGAGIWEKAGILFAEVGLERDLKDLERVRLEM